ncbi:MAG: hypothetical protein RJB01_630 [Actinomycetota bacterium]|jgi:UDP-N-acetylglucosamine--N-acetylmuramyl-(pentapeptide) pyrophosphoryl-undecaprenol N-acetylglucosamine transferase
MHVVMAAGGTAGHIEPALNTADTLRALDTSTRVTVLGSEHGLEEALVPARGYELFTVPAVAMPRSLNAHALRSVSNIIRSIPAARKFLIDSGADVVVGFGGYVSAPAYLAAKSAGIPFIVHEANARPGWANRLGARFTPYVAAVHPEHLAGARAMGMPLRPQIRQVDRAENRSHAREYFGLEPDRPVLLVFGGSQGARHLNEVIAASVPELCRNGIQLLHAVGARNELPAASSRYHPVPYIERMDLAYSAADAVLCRAGAMTCAEVAAVGVPAIFVPLPVGNGEQALNAQALVNAGAAIMIPDRELTASSLVTEVTALLRDPTRLNSMAKAAHSLGVRSADAELAQWVLDVVHGSGKA